MVAEYTALLLYTFMSFGQFIGVLNPYHPTSFNHKALKISRYILLFLDLCISVWGHGNLV